MQLNRTVFVVQTDNNKDLSDAKRYGDLLAVFGNPRKPYDTKNMIEKARRVLEEWKEGDYLLMLGDPTLCGVCMAIASEYSDSIDILSWDRNTFSYIPQKWEFEQLEYGDQLDLDL
jgi:hypothetical protein|tara:strand:+ start:570 stop:917 length:348 start_codon:yes stop_codon:yes gene_type:complete